MHVVGILGSAELVTEATCIARSRGMMSFNVVLDVSRLVGGFSARIALEASVLPPSY